MLDTLGHRDSTSGDPASDALLVRWNAGVSTSDGSLTDIVRSVISDAISANELPDGWRLSELQLAKLFGISRTPVREALAALAGSKLATRDARGALRVASVSPEQVLDLYAVRGDLYGLSAALAAENATPQDIAKLRRINEACRKAQAAADIDTLNDANVEFHEAMAASTHNELLAHFITRVHNWVTRFPTSTLSCPGRAHAALDEHDAILDAIAEHRADDAARLAREHIRTAERLRIEMHATTSPNRAS